MNSTSSKGDNPDLPQQASPIGVYALISDCHAAALVSRRGSIDWCCLPRFDSEPCFGRLLDWQRAGYCRIAPAEGAFECARRYLKDTMVLCTRFEAATGRVQVFDLLVLTEADTTHQDRRLVRIVEGLEGQLELDVEVQPRFGFGVIKPWLRQHDTDVFIAVGGKNGLVICDDMGLKLRDKYSLGARIRVGKGERRQLSIQFSPPELLDDGPKLLPDARQLDRCLDLTEQWWRRWCCERQRSLPVDARHRQGISDMATGRTAGGTGGARYRGLF